MQFTNTTQSALYDSVADILQKDGANLLDRLSEHADWWDQRFVKGYDPYSKTSVGPIKAFCKAEDRKGNALNGINLASQDYLSLAYHPKIREAATEAINTYGVHSAGSPALMGNTLPSKALEKRLAKFLKMSDCTVFATGWAAGYGSMRCLLSQNDHVLLDQLSHACLIEGANAATNKVGYFKHLSTKHLETKLKRIRERDPKNGILIVTETLFSMDSDTPDLHRHQELADQYNATLFVDVAHDLGSMGANGGGHLEMQNMLGKVDIVMGSFSKTFASNGGFVATNHPALKPALRYACGPHTFSNAISPVQASTVLKAIDIIESDEGRIRREKLIDNAIELRSLLIQQGLKVLGAPSPIVPCVLGDSAVSRVITKEIMQRGVLINLVEYPAVSRNSSRFRLQVMADHNKEQLMHFADAVASSFEQCKDELQDI